MDPCQIHYQIFSKSVLWRSWMLPDANDWPSQVNEMFPSQSFIENDKLIWQTSEKNHRSEHQAVIVSNWSAASRQCCHCWNCCHCCCVQRRFRNIYIFMTRRKRLRAASVPEWRPDTSSRETTSKQASLKTPEHLWLKDTIALIGCPSKQEKCIFIAVGQKAHFKVSPSVAAADSLLGNNQTCFAF